MDRLAFRFPTPVWGRIAVFLLMVGDILALVGALFLSLALRFDDAPIRDTYYQYLHCHVLSSLLSLFLYAIIFALFRLYRYAWRFAGLQTLRGVVYSNTIGLFSLILIQRLIDGASMPRSVLAIFWMLSIALVGGVRILLRMVSLGKRYGSQAITILQRDLRPKRAVILGAGSDGAHLLDALRDEATTSYHVIGFLDDRSSKQGIFVRDVEVLGPLNHLYELLDERAIDEVMVALPEVSGAEFREYVMACRKRKIPVKIIPALSDVLNGKTQIQMAEISVEDLLRRPPVRIDIAEIGGYVSGKRVLVTGAGGSIGSELCRQIVALNPSKLVLLGHGENSIHQIYQELRHTAPNSIDQLRTLIASVSDLDRIDQVFEEHRPEVVFHAAAHKHVPIMELNVLEAVQNNVLGTSNIAEVCGRYGVPRMVLISTDKAVYPSSIMGATKWLCEEVVRAMAALYPKTNYVTVRFGNVLGSRGSVVPILHDQIKRGGPVTITHPEMTRYFMLIPEAVQLVLQAGAIGKSGELFLLDMGKPVRIYDLACDMIRLCGHEPDVDMRIVYSGIRPGEKLHEELTTREEVVLPASCKGLFAVRTTSSLGKDEVFAVLRRLQQLISSGDVTTARDYLSEVVPGFSPRTLVS